MLSNPVWRTPLAIGLGAIVGAVSRYGVVTFCQSQWGLDFPWGTFMVNVSGCYVMGFVVVFFLNEVIRIHPDLYVMTTTGFLGSYTTFSSYELDTFVLWQDQNGQIALFYWIISAALGIIGLRLGERTAERFLPPLLPPDLPPD